MTPLEFLAVVLPSPGSGYYCAAELSSKKKEHVYVQTIEEINTPVQDWLTKERDIYFALSTFKESGSRTADNAQAIRALFIDIDNCPVEEAEERLTAFLAGTELDALGQPWTVVSGGGVHAYWPLTEAVDIVSWKPVAENFKRLCKQEGLDIDMTVTADAARVLRVPGTFNYKKKYGTPRPVALRTTGGIFDFDTLAAAIRDRLTSPAAPTPTATIINLPGTRPAAPTSATSATSVKLFENSTTRFKTIWLATQRDDGCKQLAHYVENADDDGMEPLWRGWLSIAQKCVDGEKAAIWLSKLHPYDTDRMNQKLREIKGPYPCIKFDSENPGICTTCRYWGRITNPLALGRETALDLEEKTIEIPVESESEVAPAVQAVTRPQPPKGFAYGAKGGVYVEKEIEQADGTKVKKQSMILPYDLFVVDILNTHGEHTVHMLAMRPEGPTDVTIPAKAVVSKDETVKSLAHQNIIAAFGAGNDKNLFEYTRACVEEASSNKRAIIVPDHYGWQGDGSYVYAGRIFQKSKPSTKVPMPGLENIISFTEPAGVLENWRKFVNMLINKKMYKHLAVLLAGAGAPLMRYTGLFGMTFHCASTESGTGKSLALEAAASVWGHPSLYRTNKSTSAVAMQQRLGLLHCHPLISDELTAKNRQDFEWLPGFLLDMTEGKGKERMESGANKERLNLSTWRTNALLSSNTHIVDYLTGGRKHASEGELRRLLEFVLEDELSWTPEEVEIIKSLQKNYGIAGYMMVEYMVEHEAELAALTTSTVQRMYKAFNATNDERFWMAGIGSAMAAGIIWSSKYAGIIDLPLQAILDAFKGAVMYMRQSMKVGVRTAEDVLSSYVGENYGKFIVVKKSNGSFLAELGGSQEVDASITRSTVAGRVERDITPGYVDFFIEEQMLKAYCAAMSFGYAAFCKKLTALPNVTVEFLKKDMTAKTRAPQMRVNAIKIRRREEDVDEILAPAPTLEAA